jgi:hypothetical protein
MLARVSTKRFRVALSFPGEKRDFIRQVADLLAKAIGKERVLYDDYLTAELARPNLDVYLGQLYHDDSELLVPFFCVNYERKEWCGIEWRQMRDILKRKQDDHIMPFRFDDTPIAGVLSIDGYVKIHNRTPQDVADLILQRIGASVGVVSASQPQIAPTRLRHGAEKLFGRENELKLLDEAWNNQKNRVATFVAFGGVGKTSLIFEWMNRLSADGWRGAERVFDWTFYSQGTRDTVSSDAFIAKALEFFGDTEMAKSNASPWDKGARLAQLVAQKRSLLVLDGLEPLQYPPGPMSGRLKDPAIETLLKGLARQNPGLCIITTRETVSDLAPFHGTTAPEWELDHLSEDAGAALLEQLGVNGTLTERRQLSRDVNGHALTLNLMGSYLTRAFGGDIRKRDQVKFEKADANVQGGHAFKAMAAYEKWLAGGGEEGQRQLAVLRVLGLFDHPASAEILAVLRSQPPIAHLTKPLVGLSEEDWNITLTLLVDNGLAFVRDDKSSVDAHPLIREYFAAQIRKKNLVGWRSAHRRLYEHLCLTTPEKPQPTLEDLQPLYQAVAHGCQAGLQQDAYEKIWLIRIRRRNESYSSKKLGAQGFELDAAACFFESPWSRLLQGLTEGTQARLLGNTAYFLRALGRLVEALEVMQVSQNRIVSQKDWRQAAINSNNLSELKLTLGKVVLAVREAEQSVIYADRHGDADWSEFSRTTRADALHQMGHRAEAKTHFLQAEQMQAKRQPYFPLLYSLYGVKYCDLLLAAPERVAWQIICSGGLRPPEGDAAHRATLQSISQRATQTLKIHESNNWLLDIALDHLTLGRAALYAAILESASSFSLPTSHLESAVAGLRRAGTMNYISQGLLTRAWLRFLTDPEHAQVDLDEAWEIAERGPMKLFLADIHLHRARLFFREKSYPWKSPEDDLADAEKFINDCGYHRRDEELADAKKAILGK